jgi:hypothetical protein
VAAEEEMLGVYAPPLVAAVANIEAGRDGAILDHPRQSMSEIAAALEGELPVSAGRD